MRKIILLLTPLLLVIAGCTTSDEQSLTSTSETLIYNQARIVAKTNVTNIINLMGGVSTGASRQESSTLIDYIVNISDEELDSLLLEYPITDGAQIQDRYEKAIDRLYELYPFDAVTEFVSITNSYFCVGGQNEQLLLSNSSALPSELKNIAIQAGAFYDEFISSKITISQSRFSCLDFLLLDLGKVSCQVIITSALSSLLEPYAYEIDITITALDAIPSIVEAADSYRRCKRTGVYM